MITRLVYQGGQARYLSGPGFFSFLEQFIRDWQDRDTGFFGMTYLVEDGQTIRTRDLSLTFHMARYAPHLVRWWPTLIDTLLAIREDTYPEGWLQTTAGAITTITMSWSSFIAAGPICSPASAARLAPTLPIWCAGVFRVRWIGIESCSIPTRVTRSRTYIISQPRFLTPLDSSILPRSSGPPTIYLTRVQ